MFLPGWAETVFLVFEKILRISRCISCGIQKVFELSVGNWVLSGQKIGDDYRTWAMIVLIVTFHDAVDDLVNIDRTGD